MALRNLELRIKLLKGFIELWKTLHDVLVRVSHSKDVTDEDEQGFLKLKTNIAYQQARLSEIFQLETRFTDEVMSMLSQVISLKDYLTLSTLQMKRIASQWNSLYMLMHGELGKDEALLEKKWFIRLIKNPWVVLGLAVAGSFIIYYIVQ